jgi:hypothetical protein
MKVGNGYATTLIGTRGDAIFKLADGNKGWWKKVDPKILGWV